MDRVVAARKLIGDLVKDEEIEVRRVEIVGKDLAKLIDTLKRPPNGQELGEWLEEHAQVTELSASTGRLDELIDRYLREPETDVTAARNPELERQLREAPDQIGAYQVYADWLQEHADPLGELIALSIASGKSDEDRARFERHLKRHEASFLGGLAPQLQGRIVLTWRAGLVQAIEEVGDPVAPEVWIALLGLRVCELVEAIALRAPCSAALDHAIAGAAPDSMRSLTLAQSLGTLPAELLQRPLHTLSIHGSYALVLAQHTFPPLERLTLRVPAVSSVVPLELAIRELTIVTSAPTVELLMQAKLPRLERLTLVLGDTSATTVMPLLEVLQAPVTTLVLRDGQIDPKAFAALAKVPRAAKLTTLGLVNFGITDESIAPLAGTRGFSSLAELDVSENELTREGLQTALGLARTIISTKQLRRGQTMERRVRRFAGTRLHAAEEIADPKNWKRAGVDGDIRWGRYRGEAEYELFVAADLSRFGCSCPSELQPCKHVVALALVAERTPLSPAPSRGIETRVVTRGGLADLLLSSVDD